MNTSMKMKKDSIAAMECLFQVGKPIPFDQGKAGVHYIIPTTL